MKPKHQPRRRSLSIARLDEMIEEATVDKQIPETLPARARNLVDFLGTIVRSVSGSRHLFLSYPVYCRKRIGNRHCRGSIAAYCKEKNPPGPIEWICPDCGDRGEILNWHGTLFDESDLRRARELEYIRQGIWINGQRLDELSLPLSNTDESSSYRLFPSHRVTVESLASGQLRLRLPSLLALELFHRSILRMGDEPVEIKIGEKPSLRFCFRGVRYSPEGDSVAALEFSACANAVPAQTEHSSGDGG